MQLMVLAEQVATDIVTLFQDNVFPASRRAQPLTVDQVKAAERLQLLGVVAECVEFPGWYQLQPPRPPIKDPYLALLDGALHNEMPTRARADLFLDGNMRLFSILKTLRDNGATECEIAGYGEAEAAGIVEAKVSIIGGRAVWRLRVPTDTGVTDLTPEAWLALSRTQVDHVSTSNA